MTKEEYAIQDKELRKAAIRACKALFKSLAAEPAIVVLSGSADDEPGCPGDDITAWLFHGRQEDGNADNSLNH